MQKKKKQMNWTERQPCNWVRANIHGSLLLTLGLISAGVLFAANYKQEWAELKPWAFTLPVVWIVSLAVRVAAQQLALGSAASDLQIRLGPTGNISTDYEYLRPGQIFRYAMVGHLATLSLLALGSVVCAALLPVERGNGSWSALIDVNGGVDSLAWAAQIIWVNALIFTLNLLPTIPFDNRALLYSLAILYHRQDEVMVLRRLAALNSHLAAGFLGGALSVFLIFSALEMDPMGWYLLAASGIYLIVAGRWEKTRANELEESSVTFGHQRLERRSQKIAFKNNQKMIFNGEFNDPEVALTALPSPNCEQTSSEAVRVNEPRMQVSEAYLDEILRKLHREGAGSLSIKEQEALLTASQRLKEKHRSQ
jgi:hypothetical protein